MCPENDGTIRTPDPWFAGPVERQVIGLVADRGNPITAEAIGEGAPAL
jgi:hypothetical protein